MRRIFLFLLLGIFSAATISAQQKLSVHWEELTADDFHHAIELSKGACILPIGILEKHGPHLPLGTDLLNVRYASLHAAEKFSSSTATAATKAFFHFSRSLSSTSRTIMLSTYNGVQILVRKIRSTKIRSICTLANRKLRIP